MVDNGSADGTVDFLEREGVPHVALPENLGFAGRSTSGSRAPRAPCHGAERGHRARARVPGGLPAALEANSALGGVQPLILQLEATPPPAG